MAQSRRFAIVSLCNWNKLPQSLRDLVPIIVRSVPQAVENLPLLQWNTCPGWERIWFQVALYKCLITIAIIVISKLLKCYLKAKGTRAPTYSRMLQRIKWGFSKWVVKRFPEYQEGTEHRCKTKFNGFYYF